MLSPSFELVPNISLNSGLALYTYSTFITFHKLIFMPVILL